MAIGLTKLGLKEKEEQIYVELLKEGPSLANHLAKRTRVLRSSIYDYLDVLLDKGYITYTIISGKKYFQAVEPTKILDNFEEQKAKEHETITKIIPELQKMQNIAKKRPIVEVFEGKEGMKSIMSYILKEKPKEIMIFGSSGVSYKLLPFFMEHWHNQRIKQKIPLRIIYNDVPEAKKRIEKGPSLRNASIRFLPVQNTSLTGTILYNDKVLLTIWDEEIPLGISIESKQVSRNYKTNFDLLWKMARKRQD